MDVVGKANKYIDEVSPGPGQKDPRAWHHPQLPVRVSEDHRPRFEALLVNTPSLIWNALGMPEPIDRYSWIAQENGKS